MRGIGPLASAWKAEVLPLYDTRLRYASAGRPAENSIRDIRVPACGRQAIRIIRVAFAIDISSNQRNNYRLYIVQQYALFSRESLAVLRDDPGRS